MKNSWLIAGAVVGCLAGAGVGACGSSSGSGAGGGVGASVGTGGTAATTTTTPGTGGTTTTTPTTGTGGTGTTTGTGGTGTTTGSGDAGMCSKITTLHPPKYDDAGAPLPSIFCPFDINDAGKTEFCQQGTEHCCEGTSASEPSTCQPIGTACTTGYTDWQCEDPVVDCTDPAKPVCCAAGASIGLSTDPACGNFAHQFHGTACVAAGSCTGIQMCTSDNECPTGKTCVPFGTKGNQVGGCSN